MKKLPFAVAQAAMIALLSSQALAQSSGQEAPAAVDRGNLGAERSNEYSDAIAHINEAQKVLRQMEAQPGAKQLLQQAKGVFIVPDYGRAALIVGGQGGAGVLLVNQGGKWTGPVFYNMGSISVGAQAGATAGSVALILMNDRAVNSFTQNNNFSLDANAGITIVNYSARAQGTVGKGDVVLWSDTEGAFAGASIAASDINYDKSETTALYRKEVTPRDIITGKATPPAQAKPLLQAMPKG